MYIRIYTVFHCIQSKRTVKTSRQVEKEKGFVMYFTHTQTKRIHFDIKSFVCEIQGELHNESPVSTLMKIGQTT
jgi:hypothetical protein